MEDNIQEMYARARKAFREIEYWPQEKVDEMVQAVAWELLKEDVRHKLGHMAVDESNIGNAEDKVNKIKNKTLGTLYDMRNAKTCGIFADAQGFVLFDHTAGLGVAHVIQRSQGLVLDFIDLVFGIADIGFIHGHMAQLVANVFFHKLPGHGLHHLVDFFLGPVFDFPKRCSGLRIHFLNIVFHGLLILPNSKLLLVAAHFIKKISANA